MTEKKPDGTGALPAWEGGEGGGQKATGDLKPEPEALLGGLLGFLTPRLSKGGLDAAALPRGLFGQAGQRTCWPRCSSRGGCLLSCSCPFRAQSIRQAGQKGQVFLWFRSVCSLCSRACTYTHSCLLKCGNGQLLQEFHTAKQSRTPAGFLRTARPKASAGKDGGRAKEAHVQGAWPALWECPSLASSPAGRPWEVGLALLAFSPPLRTPTPGPQRGPLVTQQISVWQTGHLIQSQPPFFCTTMRHAGQCMASPCCTSVCRDRGHSQLLRRHRLQNARGGGREGWVHTEDGLPFLAKELVSPSACC